MESENAVKKSVERDIEPMEKRAFKRFETMDGAYAAISPSSYKIGQIVNISLGGLVFKYIDRDESNNAFGDEGTIFLGGFGFSVGDLPFRTVDIDPIVEVEGIDFFEEEEQALPHLKLLNGTIFYDAAAPHMTEQRVAFTELTFKQIFAVDKYIRENMRQGDLNFIQVTVE